MEESDADSFIKNYERTFLKKIKKEQIKNFFNELRSSVDFRNTNKRPNDEGESGPSKKMKTDNDMYLGETVYKDNVLCYKFHELAEGHNNCQDLKSHTRDKGNISSSSFANIKNFKKSLETGISSLDSENTTRLLADYQTLLTLKSSSKNDLEKILRTFVEKNVCSMHDELFQRLKTKLNIENDDNNLKHLSLDLLSDVEKEEFVNDSQKNVEELFDGIEKGVEGMLKSWALNINEKNK